MAKNIVGLKKLRDVEEEKNKEILKKSTEGMIEEKENANIEKGSKKMEEREKRRNKK